MSEANSTGALRRTEDIALDLMKFVAGVAHVGTKAAGSTGFGATAAGKPDDVVVQLLSLYGRCREAVEGPAGAESTTPVAAASAAARPAK